MIVRLLQKEDLKARVEWMNNPKVYSSMHFDIPVTIENTVKWFENNQGNEKRADLVFIENGNIVAFGGLTSIERYINKAELYIFVNPLIQTRGIGTKATKELCKFGFDKLKLHKIYLQTNEDNKAAQRVYEKCGFIYEGKLRDEYLTKDGIYLGRMCYGLIKGELNE